MAHRIVVDLVVLQSPDQVACLKFLGPWWHIACQDGIGFPYLSPTCYWYLIGGDERAMEFVSVEDVGADVVSVISKVLV